jgi:hypothetical protein
MTKAKRTKRQYLIINLIFLINFLQENQICMKCVIHTYSSYIHTTTLIINSRANSLLQVWKLLLLLLNINKRLLHIMKSSDWCYSFADSTLYKSGLELCVFCLSLFFSLLYYNSWTGNPILHYHTKPVYDLRMITFFIQEAVKTQFPPYSCIVSMRVIMS